MENALKYLNENGIVYKLYEHEAVFTCEAADRVCAMIPGMMCKNLFLVHRKSGKFYLTKTLGESSMRFGTPEELMAKLGLLPGSVSPLGLINNEEKDVTFIVDGEVARADSISIHPNVNTASLTIDRENFRKLVATFGNKVLLLNL